MLKNPYFEQDFWSRTAIVINKIGYESIRLMKWLAYYDRSYYENMIFCDLMGSVLSCLNELSQR